MFTLLCLVFFLELSQRYHGANNSTFSEAYITLFFLCGIRSGIKKYSSSVALRLRSDDHLYYSDGIDYTLKSC